MKLPGSSAEPVDIRALRLRARAPRIALYAVVGILAVAGLRAAVAPSHGSLAPARVGAERSDISAWSFAEAFARVYLTWTSDDEGEREHQLAPFLPGSLEADAGLQPAAGTSQEVLWTSVTGAEQRDGETIVVVAARTSRTTLQLGVPVGRDERGFLYVSGYPAIVGPPVANDEAVIAEEESVEDEKLETVVARAVTNYLTRSRNNLLADLTAGAVVSLPTEPLEVVNVGEVTWVTPRHRVAVEVEAKDQSGTAWTLCYELDVRKQGRWYVSSVQVDPTFSRGGS